MKNKIYALLVLVLVSCENEPAPIITLSSEKAILSFSIDSMDASINQTDKTITLVLPSGTDITAAAPLITISDNATISPDSGVAQDFSGPVLYTVTAQDMSTVTYTVNVTVTTVVLSAEKQITSFSVNAVDGTIDEAAKTVMITLPFGADASSLSPTITISDLATISPNSGVAQDFTGPVMYTVTAEDSSTVNYTVTVTVTQSTCANPANIYTFQYNGKTYELVRENKTWANAAACAVDRGGYLAEINDAAENTAIFNELMNNAGISLNNTVSNSGGAASYVFLGANDIASEGVWVWNGNNDASTTQFWQGDANGSAVGGLYNNWGTEPDNFAGNQDALGIGLNVWPQPTGGLGVAGQWNDIPASDALYYLIEFD
ncbi:DUF5018 domain-containing protein [Kordia sp.]|uniref:DUF5018 domain-containing protein n=1 Tax=Kordia sp. TaxID=1965332 RepID=UPI003D6AA29E